MEFAYKTKGTCSTMILLDVEDDVVKSVRYQGGCHGNLQGIAALVEGMDVEEVIKRLEGIHCGAKPTSCPDQLATALKNINKKSKKAKA